MGETINMPFHKQDGFSERSSVLYGARKECLGFWYCKMKVIVLLDSRDVKKNLESPPCSPILSGTICQAFRSVFFQHGTESKGVL